MFKILISEHEPVNKEALVQLGWKFIEKYSESSGKEVYEKDNFYLSRSDQDNIVRIIAKDPSLLLDRLSDPENVRLVLNIENMQQFKSLETMLLWTSKSS